MPQKYPWCIIDFSGDPWYFVCQRCLRRWPLIVPLKCKTVELVVKAFEYEHRDCRERPTKLEPPCTSPDPTEK